MGGIGSGRRAGYGRTLDGLLDLDVRDLARSGWLVPGNQWKTEWFWGDDATANIDCISGDGFIRLEYRVRESGGIWQDVSERIDLTWTMPNYGGRRPWFICPGCGRRCAVLYGDGFFRCRHCWGLPYKCQGENRIDRMLRKKRKLQALLGGVEHWVQTVPSKPMGMHWKTYDHFAEQIEKLDTAGWRLYMQGPRA